MKKAQRIVLALLLPFISLSTFAVSDLKDPPVFVTDFLKEKNISVVNSYKNSFEDVNSFKGHYIVPPKHRDSSSHKLDTLNVLEGNASHKAWMYDTNSEINGKNTNHRAYPTFQMKKTSLGVVTGMVLIDFYVWADIDLLERSGKSWFSLATYTSYYDAKWFRTYLVNVNSDYQIHLMHVPDQGLSQPDIYQNNHLKMPRKSWVRVTTLIDYSRENRFDSPIIAVWQDEQLVSASRFNDRINPYKFKPRQYPECLQKWDKQDVEVAEKLCGLTYLEGLAQMHFGLYAPPGLNSGEIYNDHLVVSELIREK